MPFFARKLGLAEPAPAAPAATLEITTLGDVNADIVEYTLGKNSRAVGRRISRLALPDGVVVAMLTRGKDVIPPRGSTMLKEEDHLFVVQRPATRAFVERAFSCRTTEVAELLPVGALRLKGYTTSCDLLDSYDIHLDAECNATLEQIIRQQLPHAEVGDHVELNGLVLRVKEMVGNRISTVSLAPK